jgi:hypothetical protein
MVAHFCTSYLSVLLLGGRRVTQEGDTPRWTQAEAQDTIWKNKNEKDGAGGGGMT